jgi:MFS family permease
MISNAGSWMQTVAVGAFVTNATGKLSSAGLVAVAAFLPIGVLAPIGGVLADRLDRRFFLMAANALEGVMATVIAVLVASGHATAGRVTLLVFVAGCITALRLPFLQAMTPDVVPPEDLLPAASLSSAQYNLGRVFGPTLAALVIAGYGYSWAFAVNALSFIPVVVALALVRLPGRTVTGSDTLWQRLRAGARAARAEPGCRAAILLVAIVAFFAAPFIALIPAKALTLVGRGPGLVRVTGALTTAQGVGAVLGALALPSLAERFGRRRMLIIDLVAVPVALALYSQASTTRTAVVALALVGATYIGLLSGLQAQVQLRAPSAYRGRILSLYLVGLGAIYPIGAYLQGAVADRIGLPTTTSACAVGLLAVVGALAALRPSLFEALGDPPRKPVLVEGMAMPDGEVGGE